MERNIIKKLIEWKHGENRKPLIINGARQVGKTYILKEFGRLHYKNTAYTGPRLDGEYSAILRQPFSVDLLFKS